jgi:hypothetical protein
MRWSAVLVVLAAVLFALGAFLALRPPPDAPATSGGGAADRGTDGTPAVPRTLVGRGARAVAASGADARASDVLPPPPPARRATPRETYALTVLDWRGRPVKGAEVTVAARGEGLWSDKEDDQGRPIGPFREHYYPAGWHVRTKTDENGAARVTPKDAGPPWYVTVDAPGGYDARKYVQPDWHPTESTVRLARSYRVSGVVRDRQGSALPEATLRMRVGEAWQPVRVFYDGTFDVGGLDPGPVTFLPSLEGVPPAPDAPTVTFEAGTENAVIEIDVGAELDLAVDGFPDSTQGVAYLTAEPAPRGLPPAAIRAELSTKGTARIRGLRRDATYVLWIPALEGKGCHRRGVRAADSPLRVRLEEQGTVTCRLAGSDGSSLSVWGDETVNVHRLLLFGPGVNAAGEADEAGRTFSFAGLPEGRWTVRVEAESEEGPLVGETSAETGTTVDVRLRAVPGPRPNAEEGR